VAGDVEDSDLSAGILSGELGGGSEEF
jgi:hypothetical protein